MRHKQEEKCRVKDFQTFANLYLINWHDQMLFVNNIYGRNRL